MIKYYYAKDGERIGPVSLEMLQGLDITKDTLIWYKELDTWTAAGEIEELSILFEDAPPQLPVEDKQVTEAESKAEPIEEKTKARSNPFAYQVKPTNWLIPSIILLIVCCNPFAIVPIVYSSQINSKFYAQDFEGASRSARKAQAWFFIALVLGIVLAIGLSLMNILFNDYYADMPYDLYDM